MGSTGASLDRFQFSPRVIAAAIGLFFMLPRLLWFITRRWWDRSLAHANKM